MRFWRNLNVETLFVCFVYFRRLLEKYGQYQEQLAQLKAQGTRGEVEEEEMEEILTPDEKSAAEGVRKTIRKFVSFNPLLCVCFCLCFRLEAGELQLDETIMTLSNYIRMA